MYSKNLLSAEKFSLYIPNPNVEIFRKTVATLGLIFGIIYSMMLKNAPSIKTYKSRYLKIFLVEIYLWYQMRRSDVPLKQTNKFQLLLYISM